MCCVQWGAYSAAGASSPAGAPCFSAICITVAEDTALRAELRKNNVEYAVVKNTLLQFAVNNPASRQSA